jgi:hypothetical protein
MLACRVMAEVMLDEIGRRPGAASKEDEDQHHAGSSGLHKVWGQGGGCPPTFKQPAAPGWCVLLAFTAMPMPIHCTSDRAAAVLACAAGVQGVTQDREGYALAAGLALGLITLGKGRAAVGLADLHLEDKLRWALAGRVKAARRDGATTC